MTGVVIYSTAVGAVYRRIFSIITTVHGTRIIDASRSPRTPAQCDYARSANPIKRHRPIALLSLCKWLIFVCVFPIIGDAESE